MAAMSEPCLPTRTAYVWSQTLEDVADRLPANIGRSSMVHDLIRELGLVRTTADQAAPRADNERDVVQSDCPSGLSADILASIPRGPLATVVSPDLTLGTEARLKRYHEAKYVDYLLSPSESLDATLSDTTGSDSSHDQRDAPPRKRPRVTSHGLEYDCPPFPGLAEYSLLLTAATMTACRLLSQDRADIAINWDGGRHHAMRNKASGFCYVAETVLGIMSLAKDGRGKDGKRPRIMYLDLDLHYGDGVAQAFLSPTRFPAETVDTKRPSRPPQVLTLSVHHHSPVFFPPATAHSGLPPPDTEHPFTLSIPLKAYPSSKTYRRIWDSVESIKTAFDPDYVVLQLGVDGLPGDRIGQYGAWALEGEGGVRWCVERARNWRLPICVLGGGGYDHANAARAWAVATSALIGRELPSSTPVPHTEHFPKFAPGFTLEIAESQAVDENPQEHIDLIEDTFSVISSRIRAIIYAWA